MPYPLVAADPPATAAADLPSYPEHQPFHTVATLRNGNERAVIIRQLDSTCTCTRLELGERFILPGASTTVAAEVDNANRSGEQRILVSAWVSDPEYEPLETELRWLVVPDLTVDVIPPGADPAQRPGQAWRDVYRLVAHERPDEPQRLVKRLRLEAPAPPAGGLQVTIAYPGTLWRWRTETRTEGVVLVHGEAAAPDRPMPVGTWDERVELRTNHPAKPLITIQVVAVIDPEAGRRVFDPASSVGP